VLDSYVCISFSEKQSPPLRLFNNNFTFNNSTFRLHTAIWLSLNFQYKCIFLYEAFFFFFMESVTESSDGPQASKRSCINFQCRQSNTRTKKKYKQQSKKPRSRSMQLNRQFQPQCEDDFQLTLSVPLIWSSVMIAEPRPSLKVTWRRETKHILSVSHSGCTQSLLFTKLRRLDLRESNTNT
jgi:hypothetical protein